MTSIKLDSPDFKNEEFIPRKFSCRGEDINPTLLLYNIPEGAVSLTLIVDDPDAPVGVWDHWILWNLDPKITKIPENSTPKGCVVGKNSWGLNNYGGPCPPSGVHRYYFKLYALDKKLDLTEKNGKKDTERAMEGHVISETVLMGKFKK